MVLDEMNLKILEILQEDGRTTYADVASVIDRAETTVRDRIQRLHEMGYIERVAALLAEDKVGLRGRAIVRADVPAGRVDQTAVSLLEEPVVTHLYQTSGSANLVFHVATPKLDRLERTLRGIETRIGFRRVDADVVFRTFAREKPLPISKILRPPDDGPNP